jgi:Zn-dependent protease
MSSDPYRAPDLWAPTPPPEGPIHPRSGVRDALRKVGAPLGGLALLLAKLGTKLKLLLLLLPKLKLAGTMLTMLVSVGAYSLLFGWPFAALFVVLILVHEMGHVFALRREGIRASSPMFIPFLGAVISMRGRPPDAYVEAKVGLAGPVLGSLGALAVGLLGWATGSHLLLAAAYVGFFLNLFNLLPVVPLDGGRAMAAMAPWMWFLGFGALVALALVFPNPIIFIIVLFGGMETWRRWKARGTRSLEQAAYYRVSPRNRLLVAGVYIGLIVLLVLGMSETHILSSGGHGFGHL